MRYTAGQLNSLSLFIYYLKTYARIAISMTHPAPELLRPKEVL